MKEKNKSIFQASEKELQVGTIYLLWEFKKITKQILVIQLISLILILIQMILMTLL